MNFKELGENLGLEEDEYRELIELFIDTGMTELDRLQAAFSSSDFEQISRSAHTIKGAAGNLGLTDLQNLAGSIEQSALARNAEGLMEALQSLGMQFKAIESFVQR